MHVAIRRDHITLTCHIIPALIATPYSGGGSHSEQGDIQIIRTHLYGENYIYSNLDTDIQTINYHVWLYFCVDP